MSHSKKHSDTCKDSNWFKRLLEHVESYPSVQTICHTIMVIVGCITLIVAGNVAVQWKQSSIQADAQQAEIKKEIELARIQAETKQAEAEARKQEAIAAQNPYARAADARRERPLTLNINPPAGFEVGKSDSETEINLQPISVNGKKYNHQQRNLLTLAWHIGSEIGYPETIQCILLQETLAGKLGNRIGDTNLPTLKRSYGVMQVKARTARHVLQLYPNFRKKYFPGYKSEKSIRDEEIIIQLIQDDIFNIKAATLYFAYMRKNNADWTRAVIGYNQGLHFAKTTENPKQHKYYRKIVSRLINEVRPFNKSVGLSLPEDD